jgi:3-methylcrotonyl-CoA carboxylase alpha subunit
MCAAAVKLAKSVNYEGAGTVEFLVEGGKLSADVPWYFIEMNTRLQVEHPVTEEITGLDLVEWQIRVAAGEKLPLAQSAIKMSGHAIEVRLCAEDPAKGFMPSVGKIHVLYVASRASGRLETGVTSGDQISPFYDSMIAKLIMGAPTREQAMARLAGCLEDSMVAGVRTNIAFLHDLLCLPNVRSANMDTGLIARRLLEKGEQTLDDVAAEAGVKQLLLGVRDFYFPAESAEDGGIFRPSGWEDRDGFQLGPCSQLRFPFLVDGVERNFDFDPVKRTVSLVPSLSERQKVHTREGDTRIFVKDGTAFVRHLAQVTVISRPTYDPSAIEDAGDGTSVRAPINGRVAKIFVAPGEKIEKGQRIAVVEAMKMEHVLSATVAGTIDTVPVSEGAQVVQGALIASLTVAAS